jgi:hypothetical protein
MGVIVLRDLESSRGSLTESEKVGERRDAPFDRWEDTFYTNIQRSIGETTDM